MKKLKILFVITQGTWGGAQRYIFDIAINLNQEKFETEIATGEQHQGELVEKLRQRNKKVHLIKNLKRSWSPITNALFIIELVKVLKMSLPDIIHFNSTNAGIIGSLAVGIFKLINSSTHKLKTVYTAHGFPFNEPGLHKKIVFAALEKFASIFRDKIICVSHADFKSALKYKIAPSNKLTVIHNGVDSIKLLPKTEARKIFPDLPADAILVGTISQFYPTKGLRYLIDAAKIVTAHNPRVIFAAVGGGIEHKKLESRIKNYGLQSKFILAPYQEDGNKYLSAFDIIAAPSIKEGLPYFLIEAALAGIPVVSTTVGGIPEIVKHEETGLLVPPENPAALTDAILNLLNNQDTASRYARAGQLVAENNFGHLKMVKSTEKVYQSEL